LTDAQPRPKHREHGDVLTEISDGMVGLLKDYYGVGPSQAKTYFHDDLVVCVMRGGFTRVEQTLLDGDRGTAVIEQRMAFQEVMRPRFQAVVEQATQRPVIGFMSGNQQEPDMICEVFVLAPTDLIEEAEVRGTSEVEFHRGHQPMVRREDAGGPRRRRHATATAREQDSRRPDLIGLLFDLIRQWPDELDPVILAGLLDL
jgi:uncharacterized protein YbcI